MSVNNTNRSILANYLLGQNSNKNYVLNQFAMNGTTNVSVGGAGGTPATVAKNTTTPLTGISDFSITLPNDTTNYVEWTLSTLDNSLKNQNCALTLDYKITSIGSVVQAQVVIGGVVSNSQTIAASPTQSSIVLNVPCGDLSSSTTVRISNATSNSGTSSLNVANINYGKATNIVDIKQATLIGTVKVTACSGTWTRANSAFGNLSTQTSCSYAVTGSLTAPSTMVAGFQHPDLGAGTYVVEYEGGLLNGATSNVAHFRFNDGTNSSLEDTAVYSSSSTTVISPNMKHTFTYTSPKAAGTIQMQAKHDSSATVEVYGTNVTSGTFRMWYFPTSSQQAVSSAQADYDWTSYTPTFTGFGTVTGIECQHSRVTSNLLLRCKYTTGTNTATEARISLPNSLTSADTTKIPSIQTVGSNSVNTTIAGSLTVLIEPSVTYITLGKQSATEAGLTKRNGSDFPNSTSFSLFASIPIQGWSSNQRAPTLVGSVTSNASNAERIERAYITKSGACSISSQSGTWLTSATANGTGRCDIVWPSSTFSAAPTCTATNAGTGTRLSSTNASSTTGISVFMTNPSSLEDNNFYLICMGPR